MQVTSVWKSSFVHKAFPMLFELHRNCWSDWAYALNASLKIDVNPCCSWQECPYNQFPTGKFVLTRKSSTRPIVRSIDFDRPTKYDKRNNLCLFFKQCSIEMFLCHDKTSINAHTQKEGKLFAWYWSSMPSILTLNWWPKRSDLKCEKWWIWCSFWLLRCNVIVTAAFSTSVSWPKPNWIAWKIVVRSVHVYLTKWIQFNYTIKSN